MLGFYDRLNLSSLSLDEDQIGDCHVPPLLHPSEHDLIVIWKASEVHEGTKSFSSTSILLEEDLTQCISQVS
jgi:hypothetical protein